MAKAGYVWTATLDAISPQLIKVDRRFSVAPMMVWTQSF